MGRVPSRSKEILDAAVAAIGGAPREGQIAMAWNHAAEGPGAYPIAIGDDSADGADA